MQKLFYMEPVTYDGNLFYPFFYNGEVLCLPYDYKEYAKELFENFSAWKNRATVIAMREYASCIEHSKSVPDEIDRVFGIYQKPVDKPVKPYEEIYDDIVNCLLPEFVSCKEVSTYLIKKAKESLLPVYRLDELLQLTYNADAEKENDAYDTCMQM